VPLALWETCVRPPRPHSTYLLGICCISNDWRSTAELITQRSQPPLIATGEDDTGARLCKQAAAQRGTDAAGSTKHDVHCGIDSKPTLLVL
jgi:hypothetical protein